MRALLIILVFGIWCKGFAQSSPSPQDSSLQLSAYLDTYFVWDANHPATHQRPSFLYNHNRHNEVNINLAFVKAAYQQQMIRANVALMVGTYAQYNLASENEVMRHVFEANVGIKLSSKRDLWLDVGVMPSHIGFESAISKDCWTLTRSLLAENSPYFETVAKISYNSPNKAWLVAGLVLNGWQRIQRVEGNQSLCLGTQVTYKPNPQLTLNSSTFWGNDRPSQDARLRFFHNFYVIAQLNDRLGLTLGFDTGWEQSSPNSGKYHYWNSPVGILRYSISEQVALALRYEQYTDKQGVIINSGTLNGTQLRGVSLNSDFKIAKQALFRLEAKNFHSTDKVFEKNGSKVSQNFSLAGSLAVWF